MAKKVFVRKVFFMLFFLVKLIYLFCFLYIQIKSRTAIFELWKVSKASFFFLHILPQLKGKVTKAVESG